MDWVTVLQKYLKVNEWHKEYILLVFSHKSGDLLLAVFVCISFVASSDFNQIVVDARKD